MVCNRKPVLGLASTSNQRDSSVVPFNFRQAFSPDAVRELADMRDRRFEPNAMGRKEGAFDEFCFRLVTC